MVYLSREEGSENEQLLKSEFRARNIYPLNGSGAFVVKTPDSARFHEVMDKIGFNEKAGRRGVAIEFDSNMINGWYTNTLWSFLQGEVANDESD